MMENPRLEEEKIIKDIRNLFRQKKTKLHCSQRHNKSFQNKKRNIVLRSIKKVFEYRKAEENYYKPVRVNKFWSNSYIEYKSNGDKNKILLAEEYLNKIRSYLRDLVNDLKQSDTWKFR